MSPKILFVDDDPNILAAYQRNLRKQFCLETALGGEEALKKLEASGPYAIVVADMQMPSMNGVQLLSRVEQKVPDTVRIMLTGNADQKTAVDAVNEGHVFRFLNKPCPPEMLALTLELGLKQYRLVMAERELLEKTLGGSIKVLTDILSLLDPVSFGRGQKLRDYVKTFAAARNILQTWDLDLAAMLCLIGNVTVPPQLATRARRGEALTGPERDILLRVPQIGADLLGNIPRLEVVSRNVLYQNKNFDGSGFPTDSVAGEDIPIGARILRVLSDLLQQESRGIAKFKALESMQAQTGVYDPRVLDAAYACFDVYLEQSAAEAATKRKIELKELKTGDLLISNIETLDGTLIAPLGIRVSPTLLEKLRNFAQLSGIKEPILVSD